MTPAGELRRREILCQRLLLLETNVPKSLVSLILMFTLLALIFLQSSPAPLVAGWLALGYVAMGTRWRFSRRVRRNPPTPGTVDGVLRELMVRGIIPGIAVGATALIFFDKDNLLVVVALTVGPIAMFAGQVAVAAPPMAVLAAIFVPGIGTMLLLFLYHGGTLFYFLAAVLAGFGVAITRIAHNVSGALDREIAMRLENRDLAASLEIERRRAHDANQAKTRFLNAASHDIRQPVNALMLSLSAFDEREVRGRNLELVRLLRASAGHLRQMLDGILDLARTESGAVASTPATIELQTLLDAMEREFAPLAEAKGIVFRVVPCGASLRADPLLVERVVRNLVSNAVRYTAKGGVLLGVRRRGNAHAVEVWDTGPGIPADKHEAIFEEFMRLDEADPDRAGLGLGLAIARRFADALGAALELKSRVGRGTVFRLFLPEAAPAPATLASLPG